MIGAGLSLFPAVNVYLNSSAGIIGLTTALTLQETGRYNVTILAETFPTDPRTIRYTSHWAVRSFVTLMKAPLQHVILRVLTMSVTPKTNNGRVWSKRPYQPSSDVVVISTMNRDKQRNL